MHLYVNNQIGAGDNRCAVTSMITTPQTLHIYPNRYVSLHTLYGITRALPVETKQHYSSWTIQ